MTVKIAGCWELGYSAPLTEYDLWHFPLRDFGVDELIMTPVSGIPNVTEYKTMLEVIQANSDLVIVFVDEDGEQPLQSFAHPENCLYVFGKASYSPFRSLSEVKGESVRIETHANKGLLWPHQCAVVVLYNRMMKWQ